MNYHEFGKENADTIVMFHPLGVCWDVFSYVTPILEKDWHLIIPAIPGMDPDAPKCDFTSLEEIVSEVTEMLLSRGLGTISCLYGCSMGGGCVARMLAEGRIRTGCAVMDGGMTPYRLPKLATYLIGIRDFCMTELGKHMSLKSMRSVFDPEKYTEEDLLYVKKCLGTMSAKTILRAFYSCNNYAMPDPVPQPDCRIQYWYGEQEKKARGWDIDYIRSAFPAVEFIEHKGQDHAEYFTLHPEEFCEELNALIRSC